jgi:hypothetical protein
MLTGAQVADCEAAKQLLERLPATRVLHGDNGMIRRRVEANGTLPNIPPKANRVWKNCFPSSTAPATSSSAWSVA